MSNGGCEHSCNNSIGSFNCLCNTGYSLDVNSFNCTGMCTRPCLYDCTFIRTYVFSTDNDECTMGTDDCHNNAECTNREGDFSCTCTEGFSGNGTFCDGKPNKEN